MILLSEKITGWLEKSSPWSLLEQLAGYSTKVLGNKDTLLPQAQDSFTITLLVLVILSLFSGDRNCVSECVFV